MRRINGVIALALLLVLGNLTLVVILIWLVDLIWVGDAVG